MLLRKVARICKNTRFVQNIRNIKLHPEHIFLNRFEAEYDLDCQKDQQRTL